MSLTTIELQVPSGKKVKINPMEKGMLITFEQKTNEELYQEMADNFNDKLMNAFKIPKKYFENSINYIEDMNL